ncbi:MAG: PepSY domain-containing protein [Cloacibacillus sp.]
MKKFIGIIAVTAVAATLGIGAVCADAASFIGEAKAKEIALKHAGVTAQQAQFTKMKLDRELGHSEYELEFYAGGAEYDYEIDATTGAVRSFSREAKAAPAQNTAQPGLIGDAKAKKIALSRVPGATENEIIKFHLDYENGMQVYEGEIVHNMKKYDFEIDAKSGEVVKWELDD